MTLLVFGMDGAVREWIEEGIDRGLMPNTEKLIEEGCFGDMESTIPPITIPAWVSMFSGYRSDRFDTSNHIWLNPDYESELRNSKDWKGDMVWDRVDAEWGLVSVPGTSPLWPVSGFVMEGFPNVEDPSFYPEELGEEVPDVEFEATGTKPTKGERRKAYHRNFEKRMKVFDAIDRDCDVRIEVYQLTDTTAHRSKNLDQIMEAYRKVDEKLGERMEEYDNVLLVSDHGFTHLDQYFYVNSWLRDRGYLEEKEEGKSGFKSAVQRVAAPLAGTFLRPVLKRANDLLSSTTGTDFSPKSSFLDSVDFENTQAFSYIRSTSNFGDININDSRWSKGPVEDREKVLGEIIEELGEEGFVTDVWRSEELFDDPENMPDLFFRTRENVGVGPPLFPNYLFETDAFVHKRTGVIGGHGPIFAEGELETRDIIDVAPTIAHYLGQDLECDGEVVEELFAEDFEPREPDETAGIDF